MIPMGVQTHTGELTMEELIAYAQHAEKLGYQALFPTENNGRDALAVLGAVAARTTSLTMATGIINVYTRTPMLIAMGVAALDGFGDRSMILGLGPGGAGFIKQGHGLALERPLQRVREYVEILRKFFSGERVTHDSDNFRIKNCRLRDPRPRPHIPIYLAALGPKMTELAGEIADGIIVNMAPPQHLPTIKERLAAGAKRAGRDASAVKICTLLMTCPDSKDPAGIETMRKGVAFYAGQPDYAPMFECAGFGKRAEEVRAAWGAKKFDEAASFISGEILSTYTLSSGEAEMRATMGKYLDAGTYPIIYPVDRPGKLKEDMMRCIELGASLVN